MCLKIRRRCTNWIADFFDSTQPSQPTALTYYLMNRNCLGTIRIWHILPWVIRINELEYHLAFDIYYGLSFVLLACSRHQLPLCEVCTSYMCSAWMKPTKRSFLTNARYSCSIILSFLSYSKQQGLFIVQDRLVWYIFWCHKTYWTNDKNDFMSSK